MNKKQLLLLSMLSGILLWLAWYPIGLSFLSLIAFVPLFFISDELLKKGGKLSYWHGLLFSFPAFTIWNASTTWWIWNSTPPGAIAAALLNALFMSMVFAFWHFFRKQQIPKVAQPIMFIAFWCCWEFLHLHWQISWPWLNLGNVFAPHTPIVQWYEYTGCFGGTIWILATNFLVYHTILSFKEKKKKYVSLTILLLWILIPVTFSLIIYNTYRLSDKNPIEAIIVQPNTDSWEEQYRMSNSEHATRILDVAAPLLDNNTELIIAPESAIPHSVFIEDIQNKNYTLDRENDAGFALLDSFIQIHPQINIIAGVSPFDVFTTKERASMRKVRDHVYIEFYNSSACINKNGETALYHKSKLVPGVELLPYPALFGFLEEMINKMGGGSMGVDTSQRPFQTTIQNGRIKIGAPICYESVYGELFAQFVKEGAQLMSVITNDSWWKETAGHKQHFIYSKLRAVETRRTIMRSANTGISAFIDEKGDIIQKTRYNEQTAIKQIVYPNEKLTFYTRHGDYLARIALALGGLFFLFGMYLWLYKNRRKLKS